VQSGQHLQQGGHVGHGELVAEDTKRCPDSGQILEDQEKVAPGSPGVVTKQEPGSAPVGPTWL